MDHPMPIIILAAGQSARMRGRDKLLEHIDGAPLLRLQTIKALAVATGPVIVALPPVPHPRHAALSGLDVEICEVRDAVEGMNASLRTAMKSLPEDAQSAMVLLGDLPDLTVDDLRQVANAVDLDSATWVWRGATDAGAPGHPIVFRSNLFAAFATLKGDSGGREVVAQAKGHIKLIPLPGTRARLDLDTPQAWADWRRSRRRSD